MGGAHLKAVLLDEEGSAIDAIQVQCQLWQGIEKLAIAVTQIIDKWAISVTDARHVITMTGELADGFAHRQAGVEAISAHMLEQLGEHITFYAINEDGKPSFLSVGHVAERYRDIASANWHASASLLASRVHNALMIDIGSTTTDIIVMHDGHVDSCGHDDATRMQHDELIYTGVVRTPVMAIATKLPFAGQWMQVAAEHFATTADVYRVLGLLDDTCDMASTADGQDKSLLSSTKRLARMIGKDATDADAESWRLLAEATAQAQINTIKAGVLRAYSRGLLAQHAPIIAVGTGAFLAKKIAQILNRPCLTLRDAMQIPDKSYSDWLSICMPAYAVARLYFEKYHDLT